MSHIKEFKNKPPKDPVIFLKPDTSIIKNNNPFFIPSFSNYIDHEAELIVKLIELENIFKKNFHINIIKKLV